MDLWRSNDFALDLLLLKLMSYDTIERITRADPLIGSTSSGNKGVLDVTFSFMRIHLYAVNGKSVPARHCAVYLWYAMLWITSISNLPIITKRNMVSETLAFVFFMLCFDIYKPRKNSSNQAERMFEQPHMENFKFTVLEFTKLPEKLTCCLKLMYKHVVCPSQDPRKGYAFTFNNFFNYTLDEAPDLMDGTVEIDSNGDFVA
eukprot:11953587-Ditylum_brightwellii.AAC.1